MQFLYYYYIIIPIIYNHNFRVTEHMYNLIIMSHDLFSSNKDHTTVL